MGKSVRECVCGGVFKCVCILALKKGHDINIGGREVGQEAAQIDERRHKQNETRRPQTGKTVAKTQILLSALEPKIIFGKHTTAPLPLRVESCIVFVFCARCSTRKKFWSQLYLCVCVCVPCQTISAGTFESFCGFFGCGWETGEVGPLEALCRPFNDAASGKFVQIVYGYCTCIHTETHQERGRGKGRD